VDGNCLGFYPMADFGISGAGPSFTFTRELVGWLDNS
jgi:hypothetical protein